MRVWRVQVYDFARQLYDFARYKYVILQKITIIIYLKFEIY